jgi:hypothetical protein
MTKRLRAYTDEYLVLMSHQNHNKESAMTNEKAQAIQDMLDDGEEILYILEDDEFFFDEDDTDAVCELARLVESGRSLSVNPF